MVGEQGAPEVAGGGRHGVTRTSRSLALAEDTRHTAPRVRSRTTPDSVCLTPPGIHYSTAIFEGES